MKGFRVYIDESGDEGFVFGESPGKGSSSWFVLAAAVTRAANDLEVVKVLDDVRAQLNRPARSPFHFRNLKHEHRLPMLSLIAERPIRTLSILIHKPSLGDAPIYREKGHLYRYATRLLLERVSWLCRDHRESAAERASLIFSNRSNMSYDELNQYLLARCRQRVIDAGEAGFISI